jgi:hypothetical protein
MNENDGNWLYGKVSIRDGKIGPYMRRIGLGVTTKGDQLVYLIYLIFQRVIGLIRREMDCPEIEFSLWHFFCFFNKSKIEVQRPIAEVKDLREY